MMGGSTRDYRRFNDDHANEASRFLDRELPRQSNERQIVETLIAGIDRFERLRAWIAVERALGRANGDPRSAIIGLLEDRERVLEEIGDREERSKERLDINEDAPAVLATYPDWPDVSKPSDRAVYRRGQNLATDGGEDQ